jgi:hypothetical protein
MCFCDDGDELSGTTKGNFLKSWISIPKRKQVYEKNYWNINLLSKSRGSSVGTVTGYGLDDRGSGFLSRQELGIFIFSTANHWLWWFSKLSSRLQLSINNIKHMLFQTFPQIHLSVKYYLPFQALKACLQRSQNLQTQQMPQ